jgi:hypothetical protein
VSFDNWRIDANGCSVRARRIASLESPNQAFSSEKVIGGLDEGSLGSAMTRISQNFRGLVAGISRILTNQLER